MLPFPEVSQQEREARRSRVDDRATVNLGTPSSGRPARKSSSGLPTNIWRVARWQEIAEEAPDLARRVRKVFDLRKHKSLATLRRDGSPRISGIEVEFSGGEIWLGMMPGSLKARDVQRDPRIGILAMSDDPPEDDPSAWLGDAKLAGKTIEVVEHKSPQGGHRFRVDVTEVVHTGIGSPADHLLIEAWHEGRGITQTKRH